MSVRPGKILQLCLELLTERGLRLERLDVGAPVILFGWAHCFLIWPTKVALMIPGRLNEGEELLMVKASSLRGYTILKRLALEEHSREVGVS